MATLFRKPMETYKGLHIGCAPGTHKQLVDYILKYIEPKSDVLDIGAQSGALLARLQDKGFTDLVGVDLDPTRFDVPGAKFMTLELNEPFAGEFDSKFSLITSTDVIEHLDSPRLFLIEIRKLLKPDGIVALSFPNVAFWEGRLKFLLKGELWGFGARNYKLQRHISPMTCEQTELMLNEIGYEVLEISTGGTFATRLRSILGAPLWFPLRLICGPKIFGESMIVVARRADPNTILKEPEHYRKDGKVKQIELD